MTLSTNWKIKQISSIVFPVGQKPAKNLHTRLKGYYTNPRDAATVDCGVSVSDPGVTIH